MTRSNLHQERLLKLDSHKVVYQFHNQISRLKGIGNNEIWMSDSKKFNDPLDFVLNIKDLTHRGSFTNMDRIKQAMDCLLSDEFLDDYWLYDNILLDDIKDWIKTDKDICHLQGIFNRKINSCGVSCFTSSWNNQLMWSHYANSHQGFCVEYCVRPMTLVQKNADFLLYDVQYHSSLPELCLTELLFSPYQALIKVFATKRIEWAYEREWRLIHISKKAELVCLPIGMQVSALIVGHRTSCEERKCLKKVGEKLNIPVYEVGITSYNEYLLR